MAKKINPIFRTKPIQLSEISLDTDGNLTKKIQILKLGEFIVDEDDNRLKIEKSHMDSMIKNFAENVRGIDIMLDYKHDTEGEAAAWFEKIYLSEDQEKLWAEVEWTPNGAKAVTNKDFRYVSSDIHFNYKDNESGEKFGPTLLGAGLTNRPVIKRMKPITLAENDNNEDEMNEEEKKALEEKLAESLAENKKLADIVAEMKKKGEDDDAAKELAEEKLAEEKLVKDKDDAFTKMLSEKKVVEAQRKPYLDNDMVKFAENASEIKTDVNGSTGKEDKEEVDPDSKTPAQDEIATLAEKMSTDNKISLSEATIKVLNSNKKLSEAYNKEVN